MSKVLPSTRETGDAAARQGESRKPTWRRLARALGPGLVTGASDDDPSGIATYAQAGAQFRNGTLWTVIFCLPLMMAVQEICDRTALTSGQNLGELARVKFRRAGQGIVLALLVALLVANALNVSADLMAVGEGMSLLHAGPAAVWSGVAGVAIMVLLATGSFDRISLVFKLLCLPLLAYLAVLFAAKVPWGDVLRGMGGQQLGSGKDYWAMIVAILGTTLSPYLFFWESAHRVEQLREEKLGGKEAPGLAERTVVGRRHTLQEARLDVFAGMVFSEVVMFAIIVTTAATLGHKGAKIDSAAEAAKALEPIAGHLSTVLFAAGFIGSGLLAVPVLAGSASTGIAGLMGKPWGFDRSPRKAPVFYALVGVGAMGGAVLTLVYHDPIRLLILSAMVNGIAAAPFLVIVMLISSDKEIMGKERNGRLALVVGWAATAAMTAAGIAGVVQLLTPG